MTTINPNIVTEVYILVTKEMIENLFSQQIILPATPSIDTYSQVEFNTCQ